MSDTTTNQGSAPVPASLTSFYLSTNVAYDAADILLRSRTWRAAPCRRRVDGSATLTLPATLATGTYYLIAQADGDGAIAELNEMNNGRAAAIRVGPDLVVSAFTAPTPRGRRRNDRGDGHDREQRHRDAAGASTTAFYLSANITLEAGDIRLSRRDPCRRLPLASPARRRRR